MKQIITRSSTGEYTIEGPVVFSCGCGNLSSEIKALLSAAGVPYVPILLTSSNLAATQFIKNSGLGEIEPTLKKSRHAVLYNHATTQFVNLLKASKNDKNILANIYLVVSGKT